MDEKENEIIIKSGNGNKSIGSYVDIICKELITKLDIIFKAYDNNMNKLITIEQIIKRALNKNGKNDDDKIKYEIGKDKDIPYIKCNINIDKEDIDNLKGLIGNKKNKRNKHIFNKEENNNKMEIDDLNNTNKKPKLEKQIKEEDKISDLCIKNIQEFFK